MARGRPVDPDTVLRFMANLTLGKGRWAGELFQTQPWQEHLTRQVFALNEEGDRVHREAVIFVPRKNGKTTLVASWVLPLLMEEPGGEVIGVAAKREQAALMMHAVKDYVRRSSIGGVPLTDHFTVRRNEVIYPPLDAVYRTISSDAQSEHGANPHAVVADELHAWRDPELLIAMATATAARENPLLIQISTPGERPQGIWWDQWLKCQDVLSGRVKDPEFFASVFTAPEGCAIDDEEAWEIANPGLDSIVPRSYLRRQTTTIPEYAFRRLHLGQPTTAHERWLSLVLWYAEPNKRPPAIPEEGEVYVGIDAALSRDTFAVALVHVDEGGDAHAVTKDFRPAHDRTYIDPMDVLTWVLGQASVYRIKKVYYDPAYMGLMASSMEDRGLPVEPFAQTNQNMVRASETLQRLVMDKRLRHGSDPELDAQMGNVGVRHTERGVRISKGKSGGPVDRVHALSMALDAALNGPKPENHFAFSVNVNRSSNRQPHPRPGGPR